MNEVNRAVRVVNIPDDLTEQQIINEFEAVGAIERVIIGYLECIIVFEDEDSVMNAEAYDGIDIFNCNKMIVI